MARARPARRNFCSSGCSTASSFGVVEIYFAEFQNALEKLYIKKQVKGVGPSGDFEGELNRSLDALFGPIGDR
jgi:hypothetical protein